MSESGSGEASGATGADPVGDPRAEARRRMVEQLDRGVGRDPIVDERVRGAMERVERHRFVPESIGDRAYEDRPLPIGYDVTISQPYIVALMTQLLQVSPGQRVLEVGTGSGYQAAVLAEMGCEVFTIEIIEPLGIEAAERLRALGYEGVHVRIGDGYQGWPEQAPFDRIIVTAAPRDIPGPLLEQLGAPGILVAPVGHPSGVQSLRVVERSPGGALSERDEMPVRFVPMTGEAQER